MQIWQKYLENTVNAETHYVDYPRQEVLGMLEQPASFILEIGCSTGATGREAKRLNPQCKFWGIEPRRKAAELARQRLDKVMVGMFEDFDLSAEGISLHSLDAVIFADVLEHMYNPWRVLTDINRYMRPGAQLITSIPNLGNIANINDLAEGRFAYASEGVLDITHIRFFTVEEMQVMLQQTGYRPAFVSYCFHPALLSIYQRCAAEAELAPEKKFTVEFGATQIRDRTLSQVANLCSFACVLRSYA
jgi:O-antigen biosynthesis protein